MARTRRSKEDVLKEKMTKCDESIEKLSEKIAALNEQKKEIEKELNDLLDAKRKAEQEKKLSSIVNLMEKNNYTVEDLEKLLSMPKPVVDESEEKTEE